MDRMNDIRRAVLGAAADCWALETARASGLTSLLADLARGGAIDDARLIAALGMDNGPSLEPAAALGEIFKVAIGYKARGSGAQIVKGEKGRVGVLGFRGVVLYGVPDAQPWIADPTNPALKYRTRGYQAA
jgi:hypothetical protein